MNSNEEAAEPDSKAAGESGLAQTPTARRPFWSHRIAFWRLERSPERVALLSALLGALVGGAFSMAGAWMQNENAMRVLQRQIGAEKEKQQALDKRRATAIAGVMASELSSVIGALKAWQNTMDNEQLFAKVLAGFEVDLSAMKHWSSEELCLLDKAMLTKILSTTLRIENATLAARATVLQAEMQGRVYIDEERRKLIATSASIALASAMDLQSRLMKFADLE